MVSPVGSIPTELGFEALLWREVGQHLELAESMSRLYAIITEHAPLRAISVRRLEARPYRWVTLAVDAAEQDVAQRLWPSQPELDEAEGQALRRALKESGPTLAGDDAAQFSRSSFPECAGFVLIIIPLFVNDETMGVALCMFDADEPEPARYLRELAPAHKPLRVAFENDCRLTELGRMRAALEADREALLTRLQRHDLADVVIGAARGLATVMQRVEQVAWTSAPVLILGETGSGKEVIARGIHTRSARSKGPIVRVNCGAIPTELVDSELFGHERGSFTGATTSRKGWFERAHGGTLFLDEIGELPAAAQVRLLRVLQDGTLERVGGHQTISVDVRIVAATHRDLESMVFEGTFREDLWYRLSVFPIQLPALRHRMEDLPALAAHFADRAGKRLGGSALVPTEGDLELLADYDWPGNVRELGAVIERAAILGNGKRLEVRAALGRGQLRVATPAAVDAPRRGERPTERIATIDEVVSEHIRRALAACLGRIEGPFGAARALGINPHTLRARMRKLGIEWAQFRASSPPASDDDHPRPSAPQNVTSS